MKYTTRLMFRNAATHTPLMQQKFEKTFKTIRAAAKFIESKVYGMTAISLEVDIRIFGQVIDENGNIARGIALF